MPDDIPDTDLWVIPLHGAALPPTPGDSPKPAPGAMDFGPAFPPPAADDLPTLGFHPRLRRSA